MSGWSSGRPAAIESLHLALRSQLVTHSSDTICEGSELVTVLPLVSGDDDELLCCTLAAIFTGLFASLK